MEDTLTALALKIKHATAASRELDAEIMFDLYAAPVGKSDIDGGPAGYLWPEDNPSWAFGHRFPSKDRAWFTDVRKSMDGETLVIERDRALVLMNAVRVPRLTASIDAALTLIPKDWYWRAGRTTLYAGWAFIHRTHPSNCDRKDEFAGSKEYWRGEWSAPLAICYAAIQATIALRAERAPTKDILA
jgi:hypothetical protein